MQMTKHIGTKQVLSAPMTLGEYNDYRGWDLPADENGADEGYLVEYLDGGEANHPDHENYISWSPAAVFEKAYRPTHGMTFGQALEALQSGAKVQRQGWNGKGMWLIMVPGTIGATLAEGTPYHKALNGKGYGQGTVSIGTHIDMLTADGIMQPGWLASQMDMFSDDWQIIE